MLGTIVASPEVKVTISYFSQFCPLKSQICIHVGTVHLQ